LNTELEQLRAEVTELRERVEWLEAALNLLTLKLDHKRGHRAAPNLWGLAELGRELNKEMNDHE
jgi:hypothetical protein